MTTLTFRDSLPSEFSLLWYDIKGILGRGGFGITYLAEDTNLSHKVAIKEYLPVDYAGRDESDSTVRPLTSTHEDIYKWGLENFITEAKTLAKFKHPNIVRVLTVFDKFNTAYMVMEYEKGIELSKLIKDETSFSEDALLKIFTPLMEGLDIVHNQGFIHRDIKPSNILIRDDGSPVLLDFGSARMAVGEYTKTLTSMVTYGYAPFEQYNQGSEKQGPWSDIYSLAATLYHAVTLKRPLDSMKRAIAIMSDEGDPLIPAATLAKGRFSEHFLNAIDVALSSKISERPKTILQWRDMLLGDIKVASRVTKLKLSDEVEGATILMPKAFDASLHSEQAAEHLTQQPSSQEVQNKGINTKTKLLLAIMCLGIAALLFFNLQPPNLVTEQVDIGSPVNSPSPEVMTSNIESNARQSILTAAIAPKTLVKESAVENAITQVPKTEEVISKNAVLKNNLTKQQKTVLQKPASTLKKTIAPSLPSAKADKTTVKVLPKKVVQPKTSLAKSKVKQTQKPIRVINIENEAPKLLEQFIVAFKQGDRKKLDSITQLSDKKSQLVDLLFTEYQSGELAVNSFQISKKNNKASAKLVINKMINKDGLSVSPGGRWKQIGIKIQTNDQDIAKIYWQ